MTILKKSLPPFLFIFTLFISNSWINLYINSVVNQDFEKYYEYIKFFISDHENIQYGQGLIYYFLVTLFYRERFELIDLQNIDYILSSAVQNLNFIVYIFGLVGLVFYLKVKKLDLGIIFISLSFLNLFPLGMYMRATMKPEILIFSLLTWALYLIEQYFYTGHFKYIYFVIPFLILIFNAKASAIGVVGVFLLLLVFQNRKIIEIKPFALAVIIFLFGFVSIQYENYKVTNNSFLTITQELEYKNSANINVLLNLNILDILKNPKLEFSYTENVKSIHADSIVNILLLDSFGDHFRQFFDSNEQLSSKFRKSLFTDSYKTEKRTIFYDGIFSGTLANNLDYIRVYVSVFMTIIFYSLIILNIVKEKESRLIFSLPFIGIFILYLNSLGIPTQNYNPYTGDTFKPFYYSFVLVITFVTLVSNLLIKYKKTFFLLFPVYFLLIFFIIGHPKSNSQYLSETLINNNEYSIACELNNFLFFDNNILNNIHISGNINDTESDCDSNFPKQDYSNSELDIDCESNKKACRLIDLGNDYSQGLTTLKGIPIFSLINLLAIILISLNELLKIYKLKNN